MRNIQKSDNAVVGIVATFLIVGLIVAVISVLQTTYVPKWMEERESEHMSQVADQFSQLKYAIDTHITTQKEDIPISTSITLGSKEMPFLMSTRAYGYLDIIPKEFTLNINNETKTEEVLLGDIQYSSINAYFIDQIYVHEAGGIILSQNNGNIMFIKPTFLVKGEREVNLTFKVTNITAIGGKKSISGFGTYPIQTEFIKNTNTIKLTDISDFKIKSKYLNAWKTLINSTFIKEGLNFYGYGENYTIEIVNDELLIEFSDETIVNFNLIIYQIGAQIFPGWVENTKG